MRVLRHTDPASTYGAVLDALPIVAYIANPGGVVTYLSRGWERFTGNNAREVLESGYGVVIHPDDLARTTETWNARRAEGGAYRDDFRMRFGDGSYRWTLSQADPMHASDGTIVGWFGTLTDINDLRLSEASTTRALSNAARSARQASDRAEFVERLLGASDDCVKVLDLGARLLTMSANGQRALAIADFASIEGSEWLNFWTGPDRIAATAAVSAALGGSRGRFTGYYPVEGRERFWDVTVTPILDTAGRPERLLVVSRDVTEKLNVDRELARSEERYRLLGEALPGTTWTALPDGRLDYISGHSAGDHQVSLGRLNDLWLESVHPGDRERAMACWRASLESGEPYEIMFRTQSASGAYRWQLVRALPQRDASGTVVRWVGVNVDIDDQRRADEAREQFVRLVEASDDFIGIGDEHGNTTYVNEAGRRLLGVGTLDEARTKHLLDYFMPDDRAFVQSDLLPAIARDGRFVGDYRLRHFDTGEQIPMWLNAFSLLDEAGATVGVATVSRDLRERRRYEIGMRALADVGAAMYASLDLEGTIRNVADVVVRNFASFCIVDVLNVNGSSASISARHRDAEFAPLEPAAAFCKRSHDQPVADAIYRATATLMATMPNGWTRESAMSVTFGKELEGLDVRSLIVVPIRSAQDNAVCGVLTCLLDELDPRGGYTAEDLRFAEEIAVRAGLAFYHARAYEHERRIAVTLQEASLPRTLPRVENAKLSADYRPGNSEATIGGDWYDAFVLDDGRLAITVGDVLGSGLGAAVTMGKVRQAMRSAATLIASPNAMLDVADHTVRAESADMYATALAGIYEPRTRQFSFASAGHPGPVLRHADRRIEELVSPGIMLGLRPRGATDTVSVTVPPGAALVFFTDGLIEATRDVHEGQRRLHAALDDGSRTPNRNAARALVDHVLRGTQATDDIAVLVVQVDAEPPERKRLASGRRDGDAVILALGTFEEVAKVRHAARTLLATLNAPAEAVHLTELATGELVANALRHGNGSMVGVTLRVVAEGAAVAVTNVGPAFERAAVDLQAMTNEESGRGLAMLAALGCDLTIDGVERCTVTAIIPFARDVAGARA